jgi:hypothetical protein
MSTMLLLLGIVDGYRQVNGVEIVCDGCIKLLCINCRSPPLDGNECRQPT